MQCHSTPDQFLWLSFFMVSWDNLLGNVPEFKVWFRLKWICQMFGLTSEMGCEVIGRIPCEKRRLCILLDQIGKEDVVIGSVGGPLMNQQVDEDEEASVWI